MEISRYPPVKNWFPSFSIVYFLTEKYEIFNIENKENDLEVFFSIIFVHWLYRENKSHFCQLDYSENSIEY